MNEKITHTIREAHTYTRAPERGQPSQTQHTWATMLREGGGSQYKGQCVVQGCLTPLETITPGLIRACLGNNYAGCTGVRRQVLFFFVMDTHKRETKEKKGKTPL